MLSNLLNRACTVKRPTGSETEDKYGKKRNALQETETVCDLQQSRRDEQDDQGELSDTVWNLYLPAGTELTTADKVEVDGVDYEVVGDPWPARNPRTQLESHVEATVRRAA